LYKPFLFTVIREYSPVCEYLQANIRLYENILLANILVCEYFASKYLLDCEIRLKFCEYSFQNEYFEANIRQYEKMNICMRICANILKRI
jgi:hypothetical protein